MFHQHSTNWTQESPGMFLTIWSIPSGSWRAIYIQEPRQTLPRILYGIPSNSKNQQLIETLDRMFDSGTKVLPIILIPVLPNVNTVQSRRQEMPPLPPPSGINNSYQRPACIWRQYSTKSSWKRICFKLATSWNWHCQQTSTVEALCSQACQAFETVFEYVLFLLEWPFLPVSM